MLRAALWTVRQRRYAGLSVLMVIIAAICVLAGTWQISRFRQSVHDNDAMSAHAHAAAVALSAVGLPLVGDGPAPGRDAIRFRTITASGTYLPGAPQLLRNQTVNGVTGYEVVSGLRTEGGVLLVVRGFVADNGRGGPASAIEPPPSGTVRITARLQTAQTSNDHARNLPDGEIESVNPTQQAARLGAPVYDAYATLDAKQPGTAGLGALPDPDLSNPAGGAVEPQHFAYIIQWYLFALLALAAPFVIARSEVREAQRRFLGIDPGREQLDDEPGLESGAGDRLALGGSGRLAGAGTLARRASGELDRAGGPTPEQWQRAERLAERYGRSLGMGRVTAATRAASTEPDEPARERPAVERAPGLSPAVGGANQPHRSNDAYHGAYNDYLWQLGLADGATPTVSVPLLMQSYDPPPGQPPPSAPRLAQRPPEQPADGTDDGEGGAA